MRTMYARLLVWVPRNSLMIMSYQVVLFLSRLEKWLLSSPVGQLAQSQGMFRLAVNQERDTALNITE
jgi:hypothetical protein